MYLNITQRIDGILDTLDNRCAEDCCVLVQLSFLVEMSIRAPLQQAEDVGRRMITFCHCVIQSSKSFETSTTQMEFILREIRILSRSRAVRRRRVGGRASNPLLPGLQVAVRTVQGQIDEFNISRQIFNAIRLDDGQLLFIGAWWC